MIYFCNVIAKLQRAWRARVIGTLTALRFVTPGICRVTPDEMPRGTVSWGGQDKGRLPQLAPLRGDNMGIGCLSVEAQVKCGHYFG